jgi:DNA-binding CsgD family transcriptional regulator
VAGLLTAREIQIVALVAEGRVNKQIADALRISEWTVATHLRRIFAKLGVDTRAAMVSRCLQSGSGLDARL